MRRTTVAAILGLLTLLLWSASASAGVLWCRTDPVIKLNDAQVQLWVMIPADYQSKVSGPVSISVKVPSNVSRRVVSTDEGYNHHGERVYFSDNGAISSDGSFPLSLSVKIPMYGVHQSVPVQIDVLLPSGEHRYLNGNQWSTSGTLTIAPQGGSH